MKREEYKNVKGQLHRVDGPAVINHTFELWYFNGKRHRVDGPAYIDRNNKSWYMNGLWHRLDGPAYIHGDYRGWFMCGKRINPNDYIHEEIKDFIHCVI